MDSFSGHKIVTLLFAEDQSLDDLERFGRVVEVEPPRAKLRIDRADVPNALAAILAQHTIADVAVEDPPLEEVIADAFSRVRDSKADDSQAPVKSST